MPEPARPMPWLEREKRPTSAPAIVGTAKVGEVTVLVLEGITDRVAVLEPAGMSGRGYVARIRPLTWIEDNEEMIG